MAGNVKPFKPDESRALSNSGSIATNITNNTKNKVEGKDDLPLKDVMNKEVSLNKKKIRIKETNIETNESSNKHKRLPSLFVDDHRAGTMASPKQIFSTLNKNEIQEIFGSEKDTNNEVQMSLDGFTGLYPFDSVQYKIETARNNLKSVAAHETIHSHNHSISLYKDSQIYSKKDNQDKIYTNRRKRHSHGNSLYAKVSNVRTPRPQKLGHTCFI